MALELDADSASREVVTSCHVFRAIHSRQIPTSSTQHNFWDTGTMARYISHTAVDNPLKALSIPPWNVVAHHDDY